MFQRFVIIERLIWLIMALGVIYIISNIMRCISTLEKMGWQSTYRIVIINSEHGKLKKVKHQAAEIAAFTDIIIKSLMQFY